MDTEAAVGKAIDDMPENYELKEFLESHRTEVVMSCLTEYDEEATMRMFADEAREEGRKEGRKAERRKTAAERRKAEAERKRADIAEARVRELEAILAAVSGSAE